MYGKRSDEFFGKDVPLSNKGFAEIFNYQEIFHALFDQGSLPICARYTDPREDRWKGYWLCRQGFFPKFSMTGRFSPDPLLAHLWFIMPTSDTANLSYNNLCNKFLNISKDKKKVL